MQDITKEDLLSMLDVIFPFDRDEYIKLHIETISAITEKAAMIDDKWIPVSLLRCDEKGEVYVAHWFYCKEISQTSIFE